jgi:hypothetical protein
MNKLVMTANVGFWKARPPEQGPDWVTSAGWAQCPVSGKKMGARKVRIGSMLWKNSIAIPVCLFGGVTAVD